MQKIKSIGEYFFLICRFFLFKLKIFYFKSNFYNKKISNNLPSRFDYKPSLHIINSLTSYNKKKIRIENYSLNSLWKLSSKKKLEFQNLHNFLWLTFLDIKTNKTSAQTIIENWIDNNNNFSEKTWKLDILSKRLIAWISNSNLTLDRSGLKYREKFILSITKQTNHLSIHINSLEDDENKLTCCSSLILVGLVFNNQYKHYKSGLSILKKFVKNNFDSSGFPKSRNPEELVNCLKYLILIKEWIKESQNQIPDYLEEIIFNCGKSYSFLSKNLSELPLFNGSSEIKNDEFEKYLNYLNYNFNDNSKEKSGYFIFKNKKIVLIMDAGSSPDFKYSKKYQSGCLSFEITSNGEKLISNSGFDINKSNKIKLLSRSTAAHSTLYLNNHSSCIFRVSYPFRIHQENILREGLKITKKKIISEKDFENIIVSHNGYQSRYGYIHERSIKFVKKEKIFLGIDNLIKSEKASNISYGIRFHIYPGIKIVKTQNSQSILLSLKNGEGWKFNCRNKEVLIEKGIYLGNKNKIIENENICILDMTDGENQMIEWSFEKISQ
jgi:uncharacterized heparinase superfamily protein